MTKSEAKQEIIKYWMEKAEEALVSARSEFVAGRLTFAMNRAYYACFYAASSILLKQDRRFSKHSGVRSALHQYVVRSGMLSDDYGKIYNRLFENRQEGDYLELVKFEKEQVEQAIQEANSFVAEILNILH